MQFRGQPYPSLHSPCYQVHPSPSLSFFTFVVTGFTNVFTLLETIFVKLTKNVNGPFILNSCAEFSLCAQNSLALWHPRALQIGRPHRQQFNTRHGVVNNEKSIKIHSTTVPGQKYVSACLRLPNTHTKLISQVLALISALLRYMCSRAVRGLNSFFGLETYNFVMTIIFILWLLIGHINLYRCAK